LACVCLIAIMRARRSGASGHARAGTLQSISERIRGSWGIALLVAAMVVMFGRLEGYEATGLEEPRLRWGYLLAASLLSVALMWSAGWWRTRGARTAAFPGSRSHLSALLIEREQSIASAASGCRAWTCDDLGSDSSSESTSGFLTVILIVAIAGSRAFVRKSFQGQDLYLEFGLRGAWA
jgi:hypothetical protein